MIILRRMATKQKSNTAGVAVGTKVVGIPLDPSIAIEDRIAAWTGDFPVSNTPSDVHADLP